MASPGETFARFLKEDPNTPALPLPVVTDDRLAVVRGDAPGELTYYLEIGSLVLSEVAPSVSYVVAVDAGSTEAVTGLRALQLEPATALASYTVVLPPDPGDAQQFSISTTQDITALTAVPPMAETVLGGAVGVLAANGSVSWRYRAANTTWYRA